VLHAANGIRGDPPHPEGSLIGSEPGMEPILICVLVTEIMDEFILGLDILHLYDTFMDLGHHMLRLGQKEVLLWCAWHSPSLPALQRTITTWYRHNAREYW
jgi:hypothetical protein